MRHFTSRPHGRSRWLAACAVAAFSLAPLAAAAQDREPAAVVFALPSQSLDEALIAFARVANVQVLYGPDLVRGLRSAPLEGRLSPREGLSRLLQGTGLQAAATGPGTFTLTRSQRSLAVDAATSVEDIVVTAQKRSERIQDIPMAVSAVSSAALEAKSWDKLEDYFASVPGLSMTASGTGQTAVNIRGLSTGILSNPVVAVTIDDVPVGGSNIYSYASRQTPDLDPGDLSRIEVLRGPQGALYGASSVGGLLKYVTRDPSFGGLSGRLMAGASQMHEGGNGYVLRGGVNIPLTEQLAINATGFSRRDPGYIDNTYTGRTNVNSVEAFGGRISALWRPTDRFSARFAALVQQTEGDGSGEVQVNANLEPVNGYAHSQPVGFGVSERTFQLYSMNLEYGLDAMTLTSVTGYSVTNNRSEVYRPGFNARAKLYFGMDAGFLSNDFETAKFTQELRLSATPSDWAEFIAGAFYTNEDTSAIQHQLAAEPGTNRVAGLILGYDFPSTVEEYAAFGSLTLKPRHNLDIQIGGRYATNRLDYQQTDFGAQFPTPNFISAQTENSAFTYTFAPRWRISPGHMVYGRIATGYRIGGVNPGVAVGFEDYDADKVANYELGWKGDLLDGALTFDVTAFRMDWDNIQLSALHAASGSVYVVNGPDARSEGVELTFNAAPTRTTTLSGAAAYVSAQFLEDGPVGGGVFAKTGDRLAFSAEFTGSLSIDQDIPLSDRFTGFVGSTVNHVGERLGELSAVRLHFPAYTTLDLRAGLRGLDWSLLAYAKNVADDKSVLGANNNPTGVAGTFFAYFIPRRTIGLQLSRNF